MSEKRILIVENEEQVRLLLAQVIHEVYPALEVKVAADGAFALEQFQAQQFDLLFTDYEMPRLNGLQLARAVRELSPQTYIVLMSGHGPQVLTDQLFPSCELDGFLAKPFSVFQVLRIVDSVLSPFSANGR